MERNLAKTIKEARLKANLSQRQLATLCWISEPHLCHIECGKIKKPHLATLKALSEKLNLNLATLKELSGYNLSSVNNMNLAELIKSARIEANLSQQELAAQCKITITNVYSIETGKIKKPHLTTLKSLSEKLNLNLATLKELSGYN